MDYEFMFQTDITDCYGSIYTHSIAWALHTKECAKKNRNKKDLLGNFIDARIQDMRHGQTNGIPQGSVLMDLIAELVLGFADSELYKKISEAGIEDYRILRYRDDYRIFVNNTQDGETIIKLLTEVMIGLGLKLNAGKTDKKDDVIRASIKEDKLVWFFRKDSEQNLQKHLLIIHDHARQFPNAGSLVRALNSFHGRILKLKKLHEHEGVMPLIAIVVDIAYRNPRVYALCAEILSKLLDFLNSKEQKLEVIEKIEKKFENIPNTGYMKIWLQRITLPIDETKNYDEKICKIVAGSKESLWNSDWMDVKELKELKECINLDFVDREEIKRMKSVVSEEEVSLFTKKEDYY